MLLFPIEIIAVIIGLIYVFLEYRASYWLWIVGIIMSLFYIYIYMKTNCYAWAFTYLYYLGANVYGIVVWGKKSDDNKNSGISKLPKKYYLPICILTACFTIIFFVIIYKYTETKIPICESFSTALSVIGMWLLAKKYIQHWHVWMVVNIIYALANLLLKLYFSSFLFAVYFLVSIMGLIRWQNLSNIKK